jgi:20S proteasome subunit alpha 7
MEEAASYLDNYGSPVPPLVLADRMASYVHYFTLHGALRPFGASVLMAGYDAETRQPHLAMVEPNGVAYSYHACAAGKGRQPAKTELEKLELHKTPISCTEAVNQICRIIRMLWEEGKDKPYQVEMSWLTEATGWKHEGVPKDVLQQAQDWAKEQLENEEEEEEGMEEG